VKASIVTTGAAFGLLTAEARRSART